MPKLKRILLTSASLLIVSAAYLFLINLSWLVQPPEGDPMIISHRGVYQTYDRLNLGNLDCTATRIYEPTHAYLENTQASIKRAIELGADVVEVDLKATADEHIVIFHDHTLDCRTDGTGSPSSKTLEELKQLDIGYGYTHDQGKTFPFRGKGIGQISTLAEVLTQFPETQFLLNIKDGRAKAADELVSYLEAEGLLDSINLFAYGSEKPMTRLKDILPSAIVGDKKTAKACLKNYIKWSWSGFIPEICKDAYLYVPVDKAHMLWGWPNRFLKRMEDSNTFVILMGPMRDGRVHGFYDVNELMHIPEGFSGGIWVERIETIGPALK